MKASVYEEGVMGCLHYLLKRGVLLAAKLVGFKGFCLFLGTLLLCMGKVGEDVWLTLAVTLVCSASGIRVVDSFMEGVDALDAKHAFSARLDGFDKFGRFDRVDGLGRHGQFDGRVAGKEVKYEGIWSAAAAGAAAIGRVLGLSAFGGNAGGGKAGHGSSGASLDGGSQPAPSSTGGNAGGAGYDESAGWNGGEGFSGAARRSARRKGEKASARAAGKAGKRGRGRIRAALEDAARESE